MGLADKQSMIKMIEKGLASKLTAASIAETLGVVSEVLSQYEVQRIASFSKSNESKEYLDIFLDAKMVEGRTKQTINHYKYVINALMKDLNMPIQEITIYHLRGYLMKKKQAGTGDRTLSGYRNVFSSYFGWLFKEKMIPDNPCMNLAPIKCVKKEKLPFSPMEIEMIKEACDTDRNKALVSFLMATGCRIGEVCSINIEDIDFQSLECIVLGKGRKERMVFIDGITSMLLQRYISKRTDDSPALFAGRGSDRLQPAAIRKILKMIGNKAGVANVHPHRFRRTLATNLIDRGMSIQEVANILGHENINTTMTYVFMDKRNVKNSYRKYA